MRGSQKRQLRQRFCAHLHPVKTFRGDPTRPAYTLYSLWDYPTYLAAANELDELVEQWPHNWQRTVALLAVRGAFYDNGAPHWEVGMVSDENQVNIHGLMLYQRQWTRRGNPALNIRHAQNFALAEAALIESQRRKQGPKTGKGPRQAPQAPRQAKALVICHRAALAEQPARRPPPLHGRAAATRPAGLPGVGERAGRAAKALAVQAEPHSLLAGHA